MAVTASMVKELREKSGAGMMDCKKALNETDGDVDAAVDWLRKKGLAAAAKKSGRVAAEGLIGAVTEGVRGAKETSEEEKTLAEARRKEMQAPEDIEGGMQNRTINAAVRRLWELQRQLDELRSEADNREDLLQPLEVRGAVLCSPHACAAGVAA